MTHLIVNGERIDPGRIRQETSTIAQLLADQMPEEDPVARGMRAREWAEENLIEEALLRQVPWSEPKMATPRRADTLAFYRTHQDNFYSPEMVHAAHIVCNIDERNDETVARAAIERAQAQLDLKRPFAEVADEMSECPGRGGDLGFFPRGQMVSAFDDVVFPMSAGQVSGIFRTEFGFHIAMVIERMPEGILSFEIVRERIEQHLLAEKREAALHHFVDDLRAKADIRRVKDSG